MAEATVRDTVSRTMHSHGVALSGAFRVCLRVAALSFGGPAGQIAVMHRIIVDEKKWVGESRFLHALSYCMLLPGPEAQQLATYIGWLMHRWPGAIAAGGLFVVPGIIAIMALSWVYALYGQVPIVAALFFGLKAAVLAIVLFAVYRLGSRALKSCAMIALAALAFIAIFFSHVPFPLIVLMAGVIGFVGARAGSAAFVVGGGAGPSGAAAGGGGGVRPGGFCRRRGARPIRCGCGRGEPARRGSPRACPPDHRTRVAGVGGLARTVARAGDRDPRDPRPRPHLQRYRPVLLEDGGRHLRRRLCGARLHGAAGSRALWLAAAGREARPGPDRRDDAGAAAR